MERRRFLGLLSAVGVSPPPKIMGYMNPALFKTQGVHDEAYEVMEDLPPPTAVVDQRFVWKHLYAWREFYESRYEGSQIQDLDFDLFAIRSIQPWRKVQIQRARNKARLGPYMRVKAWLEENDENREGKIPPPSLWNALTSVLKR